MEWKIYASGYLITNNIYIFWVTANANYQELRGHAFNGYLIIVDLIVYIKKVQVLFFVRSPVYVNKIWKQHVTGCKSKVRIN